MTDEFDLTRELARIQGLRAKCSFLLAVVANEQNAESERTVALLQLIDGAAAFSSVLERAELAELGAISTAAFEVQDGQGAWSELFVPDDDLHALDLVDGVNVRRLIITPEMSSSTTVTLAHCEVPIKQRVVFVNEVTTEVAGAADVSVIDEASGEVLASAPVKPGMHQFCEVVVDLRGEPSSKRLRVDITASAEVAWYQSTAQSIGDLDAAGGLSRRALERLQQARTKLPGSVFTPVTGEPLRLADVERLMSLRNKFRGERIFVMGNGPSLRKTPLDLLQNEFVFGVNRISLLFEQISWRPQFFTAFDVRVVPDNQDEFAALDIEYKFFSARYKQLMGERENHYWYHTKGFYEGFAPSFEPTVPYSGFGGGGTIGVMAIELAFFMGFSEIYLIGTDVSYSIPKTVKQSGEDGFGDGVKVQLESTEDDDANHFDPRYFGKNKKWHNPNVREMKIGFGRAGSYIEQRGGRLRNATVGGELETVERADFASLFAAARR